MTKRPPVVRPPKGYRTHHLGSASPPSDIRKADLFVVLKAWLDAEIAHSGDQRAIEAAIDSAVQRCQGALRLSDVWADIPEWLRPYIGTQEGAGLHAIVGHWEDLTFRPGLAGLTETEAKCFWWKLRGWEDWEMQRELSPKHHYRGKGKDIAIDRARWISIETVYGHVSRANRKMKGLFGAKTPPSAIS